MTDDIKTLERAREILKQHEKNVGYAMDLPGEGWSTIGAQRCRTAMFVIEEVAQRLEAQEEGLSNAKKNYPDQGAHIKEVGDGQWNIIVLD